MCAEAAARDQEVGGAELVVGHGLAWGRHRHARGRRGQRRGSHRHAHSAACRAGRRATRAQGHRASGRCPGAWGGTTSGRRVQTYDTRVESKIHSLANLAAARATCQPAAAARRSQARRGAHPTQNAGVHAPRPPPTAPPRPRPLACPRAYAGGAGRGGGRGDNHGRFTLACV